MSTVCTALTIRFILHITVEDKAAGVEHLHRKYAPVLKLVINRHVDFKVLSNEKNKTISELVRRFAIVRHFNLIKKPVFVSEH